MLRRVVLRDELPQHTFKIRPVRAGELSPEVLESFRRHIAERLDPSPRGLQTVVGDRRVRAMLNKVILRPASETFHEFLVVVLKQTFGTQWYKRQLATPVQQRHVVMRWIFAWHELAKQAAPPDREPGQRFGVAPTGEVFALLILADDLYRLQLVRRLPPDLVRRLQSRDSYQGARYEVAVASVFVRAGCQVDWIPATSSGKTCELTASFSGGRTVAVEAKSRHREGVLHQRGVVPSEWRTELDDLYRKALHKDPQGHPLVVFLDVNRPHEPRLPAGEKLWQKDIFAMFERRQDNTRDNPARESLLVMTNWSWHLDGGARATPGEYLFALPTWTKQRIADRAVLDRLVARLNAYGAIPTDE